MEKKKKVCTKCGSTKLLSEFYTSKSISNKSGVCSWCKKCCSAQTSAYRKKHPEKVKAYRKRWYENGGEFKKWEYAIKKKFGINAEQYNKILKKQNYNCALCSKPQKLKKKRFAVDHNHKTGFIRGLLCDWCNWYLLRFLKDNKRFAIGMVTYLSKALKKDKDWS